jgi:hypothetical protein
MKAQSKNSSEFKFLKKKDLLANASWGVGFSFIKWRQDFFGGCSIKSVEHFH